MSPSPTDDNGRQPSGRFAAGNRHGRGNPMAQHVQRLRVELLEQVTPDDIAAIARKLIALAMSGDLGAIRELLNRTIGRPTECVEPSPDDDARLPPSREELERLIELRGQRALSHPP